MNDELQRQVEAEKQSRHTQVEINKLLKPKPRSITSKRRKLPEDNTEAIDQSYDELYGDWADWLDTSRAYDRSVPKQDQLDVRHNIFIELAQAKARDEDKPIPKLRQYRIASLVRVNYWREQGKGQTKVCILDGIAKDLHCKDCQHKPKHGRCPWLAVRPMLSLDLEVKDSEGETVTLADTIADDKALDLEAWNDAVTWLLGCPTRLIQIADKTLNDKPLTGAERKYLCKWRKREQKRLV